MLPTAGTQTANPRKRGNNGIPYLKNEHLSTTAKAVKILGVRTDLENKYGAAVVLKLAMDGHLFFWTVRIDKNPNYGILLDKFGSEENNWTGQQILIGLEQDEFTESYFPRVTFPEKKKGGN